MGWCSTCSECAESVYVCAMRRLWVCIARNGQKSEATRVQRIASLGKMCGIAAQSLGASGVVLRHQKFFMVLGLPFLWRGYDWRCSQTFYRCSALRRGTWGCEDMKGRIGSACRLQCLQALQFQGFALQAAVLSRGVAWLDPRLTDEKRYRVSSGCSCRR